MSAESRYLSSVLMEAVEAVEPILGSSCGRGPDGYVYRANRGTFNFTVPLEMVERLAAKARPALSGQVAEDWDREMREDARFDRDLEIPRWAA